MMGLTAVAALVISIAPALDTTPPETSPSLKVPTMVFAAAATADWVTTYQMLGRGGYERNPTLAWLDDKPGALVALGAAMDVAGVWAWNKYVGKRHPKLAKVGLYVMAGFRTYLAIHNSRINRDRK